MTKLVIPQIPPTNPSTHAYQPHPTDPPPPYSLVDPRLHSKSSDSDRAPLPQSLPVPLSQTMKPTQSDPLPFSLSHYRKKDIRPVQTIESGIIRMRGYMK